MERSARMVTTVVALFAAAALVGSTEARNIKDAPKLEPQTFPGFEGIVGAMPGLGGGGGLPAFSLPGTGAGGLGSPLFRGPGTGMPGFGGMPGLGGMPGAPAGGEKHTKLP